MTRTLGGRLLGIVELAAHEVEPVVPELAVGQVGAGDRGELLGATGAAGAEQLDVARYERFALLEVPGVDGQGEQAARTRRRTRGPASARAAGHMTTSCDSPG